MRWDSPPVLVVVGTLAIHGLLLTAGDAIATFRPRRPEPAPAFELVDISDPEPPPVAPPPPLAPPDKAPLPTAPVAPPRVARVRTATPRTTAPPAETRPVAPPAATPGGSEPVAPGFTGLAVPDAHGSPGPGGARGGGRGQGHGAGSGSGSGEGSGAGPGAPAPMSIATIKTRALPHGDYSYFGAGKDYPPEAKALEIEGVIRARLVVDAGGHVTTVLLLNKLGHGLDELAERYAHAIEFDAARDTDDHPVASVVVWTFHFALPR